MSIVDIIQKTKLELNSAQNLQQHIKSNRILVIHYNDIMFPLQKALDTDRRYKERSCKLKMMYRRLWIKRRNIDISMCVVVHLCNASVHNVVCCESGFHLCVC